MRANDLETLGGGSRWLLLVMVWGSRLGDSEQGQGSRIGGGMIAPQHCWPLSDGEENVPGTMREIACRSASNPNIGPG